MGIDFSRWSWSQREAIQTRGCNVLVSAGAGSGKTSVLVERVVACLFGEDPLDVTQLLVLTFTEAAAAEMRQRIGLRLSKLLGEARNRLDEVAVNHISRQLARLDQAQISTLHSFCLQVVRDNFFLLGREPKFTMLGEDTGLMRRMNLLTRLVNRALSPTAPVIAGIDAASFARTYSRFAASDITSFAQLVFRADTFARSQPDPQVWLMKAAEAFTVAQNETPQNLIWYRAFSDWITIQLERAQSLVRDGQLTAHASEGLEGYADSLLQLLGHLTDALTAWKQGDLEGTVAMLLTASALPSPRAKDVPGKKLVQDKRTQALNIMKETAIILGRGWTELLRDLQLLTPEIQTFVAFVLAFQTEYSDTKQVDGVLDFADLEHLALDVLRDSNNGEAARLRQQYAEIFVDEYQDTSPIQDAIVACVARPTGNVFIVGDVKQSIYRFRMAEPQLFLDKYDLYQQPQQGKVIDLRENYRSRQVVVDAVNFFFRQIFSPAFGGISYDDRMQMVAGASYPSDVADVPVEIHLIERSRTPNSDNEDTDAVDVDHAGPNTNPQVQLEDEETTAIEKEATVIARRIQELMGDIPGFQRQRVWDKEQAAYRPILYRDIVILLRSTRGRVATLLDVFRTAAIPAYGPTKTGFYDALEIRWLVSALYALDNPRRDVEFAAFLKSPLVGFTDADLAALRPAHGGRLYEAVVAAYKGRTDVDIPIDTRQKLARFYPQFQAWRTLARRAPVARVVQQLLDDTGYAYYVSAMAEGPTRYANVMMLVDDAYAFDQGSFDGVYGFVQRLRQTRALAVERGEARTLGEQENVVRIMTIHHSKGLEFPVVFVADIGKRFYRSAEESAFALHPKLGFGPYAVEVETGQRWKTFASLAIAAEEAREFLEEEARVLYVALTRARESLILVGSATGLGRIVERATRQTQTEQQTLALEGLLSGTSFLDWILACLMHQREARTALVQTFDISVDTEVGVMQSTGKPFDLRFWNTVGGTPLPQAAFVSNRRRRESAQSVDDSSKPWGETVASQDSMLTPMGPVTDAWIASVQSSDNLLSTDVPWADTLPVYARIPAKVSATDLRRLWVATQGQTDVQKKGSVGASMRAATNLLAEPRFSTDARVPATAAGTAFHAVMQHLSFATACNRAAIGAALDNLVKQQRITQATRELVVTEQVLAFLSSRLGERLRLAKRVWREQPFFQQLALPAALQDTGVHLGTRFVINQGVIDVLAEESPGRWLIVDYKTDRIEASDAVAKAGAYLAQVGAYRLAVVGAYQSQKDIKSPPIAVEAVVYFVAPAVEVSVPEVDISRVFVSLAKTTTRVDRSIDRA